MNVSNQSQVSYSYDNANRLTGIAQGTSTVSFAYDNANRRTTLTLPNGITMSSSYDSGSQLTGINYTLGQNTLGNLAYSYDLAGRRTTLGGSLAAVNLPLPVSTTAYDAANELTQWGTATPTYDANGNTLSDGTNSYSWDARNHLVSMNMGGSSFQYDAFGRRVAKTTLPGTTNYLYDGANPVQELSGSTVTANLLTGLGIDEYFQRTDSSGAANFLTDALGSTLALTDNSGNTLAQYTYEPFGNTTVTGSSTNPYQYTGRENDGTGIYFNRARFYSPTVQRFASEDPIGVAGGTNLYAYTANNPLSFRDPFGTDKESVFGCTVRVGNELTLSNALSYAPWIGQYLQNGSWGRTAADVFGGNAVTGLLGAGQTLFGNSASAKQLAQAGVGTLADPSLGLNPAVRAAGGRGVPSAIDAVKGAFSGGSHVLEPAAELDVLESGGALTDAAAEGASGVGLIKLGIDLALTVGSGSYCALTQYNGE